MATVQKLPSGNYRARANYRDELGNRHQKSFTAATRRDALQLADRFETLGKAPDTIGDCLDAFLAFKSPILSPSTVRGYISMVSTIKTRYAAFCALTAPSQRQAQALVSEMIAENVSPKSIKNRIGLITSAVKFSGGTFPNVSLPKIVTKSDYIPSENDMQRITDAVAGTKMEIPVALGMMGLRRSEVCAISPADLDGNVLHIQHALVLGADKQHYLKGTKTDQSDRYIRLPDALANQMRDWKCELSPMAITHAFRKITARLGINCRFHDLRHFFVSYCHNVLGLSDAQIQKLGGWKTNSVLRRHYLHSMHDEETQQLVADAFGDILVTRQQKKP